MSALLALLLAQAAPAATAPLPPPTAAEAEEIVVIGERLKTWRGGVAKREGKLVCRTRTSSGDKDIDAVRCGAMLRCFAPKVAEMDRIAAADLSKAERNRQMQAAAATTKPCLEEAEAVGVRMLAARRATR